MDRTLLIRAVKGDKEAEDKVIEENMGLVYMAAGKFASRGYDKEDLAQVGAIGLIKAVRRFDLNYDVQFSTYAVPLILGEIKRFLRDDGGIKVSRSIKELSFAIKKEQEREIKKSGRELTVSELSERLGREKDDIVQAISAVSELQSVYSYDNEGNEVNIIDKFGGDEFEESVINKLTVEEILSSLSERERFILVCRYFKGKTQSEIAKLLSLSQVQISRIEKGVIERIKKQYENIHF